MTEWLDILMKDYGPMGIAVVGFYWIFTQNRTDANRREKNFQKERLEHKEEREKDRQEHRQEREKCYATLGDFGLKIDSLKDKL